MRQAYNIKINLKEEVKMFIKLNDERIVNLDKVVEIKISEIDDKAVKYVFDTTEVMVEKYDSNTNAKAGIAKVTDENFVDTEDEKKINKNYIKDVKVSAINPLKVEYVLFDGAPRRPAGSRTGGRSYL